MKTYICLSAIVVAILPGCGIDLETSRNPEYAFERTFGTKPPPAVGALQGEISGFRDWGTCYLRFKCFQSYFYTLAGTSFNTIPRNDFVAETSNAGISGPTPVWWTPLPAVGGVFLKSTTFHPTFSRGTAFASYDPATGVAHFYWNGSD